METKEWRTIDKSKWARGPWDNEPDKTQFQDMKTGLPCLIVRVDIHGALCGYVGVSEGHPCYEKHYNSVPYFDVHGGLTFSGFCHGHICHIPGPGESDKVWWLGFDCVHFRDMSPAYSAILEHAILADGAYRDIGYVKAEIASLARQLVELVRPAQILPKSK